jgi:glycine betaine/proline transport system ATP-binding protein
MADVILKIEDVSLCFPSQDSPVLHRLSLDIHSGEIFVLMGASGSGKSSLLRCLNGLNGRGGASGILRGRITFYDGHETLTLTEARDAEWQRVRSEAMVMVFQEPTLQPWRTVAENLAFPLELRRMPDAEIRERVEAQLRRVHLEQARDRLPHELSGGMQQRVGIARALITEAPILLMDEPFSALDPLLRYQLQDELLELNKKLRKTIIFVTHDRDEALRLGSRMAILSGGEILQVGTPRDLFYQPLHPTVRALLHPTGVPYEG